VEKIENVISQSILISQCFVYGDSLQSCLVAIIVPDEELALHWASEIGDIGVNNATIESLCQSELLKEKIMKEIMVLSKANGLKRFEVPKTIFLEPEQFTVEKGLITPTFKLKRTQLRDFYQDKIDQMYSNLPVLQSKL